MAACADQELLLGGLVDNELDAANVAMVEAHVARCEECREALDRLQALRRLLRGNGVRYALPESLPGEISALAELAPPREANGKRMVRWLGPGAVGALAASVAMVTLFPPGTNSALDQQIISSHVRSLQPGHLTDVQTTNQHVVKPWFNGRIDFSPPVPELAGQGFPLAGGRLDSIDGKTVAAIVYHRRLHSVNVFVWPAKDEAERSFAKDGFTVREWSAGGLRFTAVSDIPSAELRFFEQIYRQRSS